MNEPNVEVEVVRGEEVAAKTTLNKVEVGTARMEEENASEVGGEESSTVMSESEESRTPSAKRRRRGKNKKIEGPEEEERKEMLFSVSVIRESEAEHQIEKMEKIIEIVPDLDRLELGFFLLKRSIQRKLYKKYPE